VVISCIEDTLFIILKTGFHPTFCQKDTLNSRVTLICCTRLLSCKKKNKKKKKERQEKEKVKKERRHHIQVLISGEHLLNDAPPPIFCSTTSGCYKKEVGRPLERSFMV